MLLELPSRVFGRSVTVSADLNSADPKPASPLADSRESEKPPSYRESKTQTLNVTPSEAFAFVKTAFALPTSRSNSTVQAMINRHQKSQHPQLRPQP
jgi:hypothetical protein